MITPAGAMGQSESPDEFCSLRIPGALVLIGLPLPACICLAVPDIRAMLMSAAFLISALIQFALGLVVAWLLGPAEFGAYALALSAAILLQTLVFEWIRLSATRFHHAGDGGQLAALLLRLFTGLSGAMLVLAVLLLVFGGVWHWLFCQIPLLAVAAGFADFRAALLRAEFNQRGYALLMLLRNLLAMGLLPLAAWRFGSAEAALGAFLLALVLAGLAIEVVFRRNAGALASAEELASTPEMAALLRYALPIVATNGLYLLLFLGLRSAVAWTGGLAAAGRFSLALDFTSKLFTTIGTALDLMLFQVAVREAREKGEAAGRLRVRRNAEIVLAVLLPMALGLALVIPELEGFLVAPEFRGAFSAFVLALVPGITLYALVQYALHPFLQLDHRTGKLAIAALASLGIAGVLYVMVTMASVGISGAGIAGIVAVTLTLAMATACAVLMLTIGASALPAWGFSLRALAALGTMSIAVLAVRSIGQGWLVLPGMILAGGAAYGGIAYVFDLAGIRTLIRMRGAEAD